MRRNKALVAAVLALSAACRRAPTPSPDGGSVSLNAPAPSASFVTSPLASESTGYTNEMQQENLRGQAVKLGIKELDRPGEQVESARPPIGYEEGVQRTQEFAREFEAERHALDRDKEKSVALPTATPGLLPVPRGAPPSKRGVQKTRVKTRSNGLTPTGGPS